jgi:hypothetical protein
MTRKDLLADSILAASAITKNRFVGFDGAHCAAGKKALGVAKDDFEAGEMAAVEVYGIQVLETGGIFAAGDPITSDSTGRAVKAADFAVTTAVTFPTNTTPVTSDAAHPTLTAANTLTGGVLPVAINGHAKEASSGAGQFARVVLK